MAATAAAATRRRARRNRRNRIRAGSCRHRRNRHRVRRRPVWSPLSSVEQDAIAVAWDQELCIPFQASDETNHGPWAVELGFVFGAVQINFMQASGRHSTTGEHVEPITRIVEARPWLVEFGSASIGHIAFGANTKLEEQPIVGIEEAGIGFNASILMHGDEDFEEIAPRTCRTA